MKICFISPRGRDCLVLPVDLDSGPQRLLFARNQALFDAGCGHGDRYTVYYAERVNGKFIGTIRHHGCRDISREIPSSSRRAAACVADRLYG